MDRALVAVDDTDAHRSLLADAGEIAAATGAELVLLAWTTPERVERDAEALESVEQIERMTYSDASAVDAVRNFATELAADALDDPDAVDFAVVATVTESDGLSEEILSTAADRGCDHVYVVGRRRSPTGKALFGDTAQRVALNFDGPVTIAME